MKDKDYISIKEFAERAGVSTQSIYKRLNKKNSSLQPFVKRVDNQVFLQTAALQALYGVAYNQDATPQPVEQPSLQPDKENNSPSAKEKEAAAAAIYPNIAVIELLRQQLEIKDQQLKDLKDTMDQQIQIKDKQIEDYSKRLEEAHKVLDQQQKLAALDKQKILELEAKQQADVASDIDNTEADIENNPAPAAETIEEPKRKGFFSRIFGR